jgi:hypothetical protein
MAVLKKHLTPLTKGGSIVKHAGKGSKPFAPNYNSASINDYAKSTPMANPSSPMQGVSSFGGDTDQDGM